MPSWAGDAMALGCALAWAVAVLSFRRLDKLPPTAVNLFKNAIATVLLLVTMAVLGMAPDAARSATDWASLVLSGVLGLAVADTLFLAGLRRIDASVAAVADCAYSPTVVVLSTLFLREPLAAGLIVGGPLVVVGLLVVSHRRRDDTKPIDRAGLALVVAGVVTTAIGVVIAKPALDRSDLLEATTIRLASGSIALFLFETLRGRRAEVLSLFRPQPAWRPALVATFFGTYVSMILWLGGMKYGSASRAALLNQMGAIFVLVLSRFAGEVVPLRRWIGAAIAVSGVAVILLA
ncbi:MAG: DMT family transporter [Sandaracinaceae bacterium]|nr:DMT family transporter [Sandaracinaceae bacterium]